MIALLLPIILIPALILIVYWLHTLEKKMRQTKDSAKFDDILINQKNPLRNAARARNIYRFLEKRGNNPEKVRSFKAELERRLDKIQEDYSERPETLKKAQALVERLDIRLK